MGPAVRILFISKSLPGPEVDGYVVRNRGLLSRFGRIAEVDVLSYDVGALPEDLEGAVARLVTVPDPGEDADPLHRRALGAFSAETLFHRAPRMDAELARLTRERRYDLVWIAGWQMCMYLPRVRALLPGVRIVADAADDEVRSLQLDRAKADTALERMALWRSIMRHERFERRNLRGADVAVYVSSADAETTAARHPGLPVEVLPNGVDTDAFAPPAVPSSEPVIVFEGTMTFGPNIEGALHLGRAIMPLLRERVPEARAMIVGRNPVPEVRALASDSIEVTGTVEDVRATVLRGSVSVCPLLGGTGQKNKILQAWSMAMPIVATPVSVPGLEAHDGANILLAQSPVAFADACARLLRSPELRAALGRAGRRTALEHYSVERRLDDVQALVERLLQGSPRAAGA